MPIDIDALKGGASAAIPQDGLHKAMLDRAKVQGDYNSVVLDWSDGELLWSSWYRFERQWPAKLEEAVEMLAALGIAPDQIDDEEDLEAAVAEAAEKHPVFEVRTESGEGRDGKPWTNTVIEGAAPAEHTQERGPEREPVAVSTPIEDDDIPF